jgi:hypothetical protein
MAGSHRLVIPHVLVDCQRDALLFTQLHKFHGFTTVDAEWFLREDASQFVGASECPANHIGLAVRWDGHIQHLDFRVPDNLFNSLAD